MPGDEVADFGSESLKSGGRRRLAVAMPRQIHQPDVELLAPELRPRQQMSVIAQRAMHEKDERLLRVPIRLWLLEIYLRLRAADQCIVEHAATPVSSPKDGPIFSYRIRLSRPELPFALRPKEVWKI